jgi:hypothetical protein
MRHEVGVRTDRCILFDSVAGSMFSLSWTGIAACLPGCLGGMTSKQRGGDKLMKSNEPMYQRIE